LVVTGRFSWRGALEQRQHHLAKAYEIFISSDYFATRNKDSRSGGDAAEVVEVSDEA
jgi:hypothetical protein